MIDLSVAQQQMLVLFEQNLFVLVDPLDEKNTPPLAGEYLKTKMPFTGNILGEFVLLFPQDKSKEIIGNFLGLESDDPELDEMSEFDATSEIMNILGAHVLSKWLEGRGRFEIGLPDTTYFVKDDEPDFYNNKTTTGVILDGKPVFFKVNLKCIYR